MTNEREALLNGQTQSQNDTLKQELASWNASALIHYDNAGSDFSSGAWTPFVDSLVFIIPKSQHTIPEKQCLWAAC